MFLMSVLYCLFEPVEALVCFVLAADHEGVDDAGDPEEEGEAEVRERGEGPAGDEDGDGRRDDGEDFEHGGCLMCYP